MKRVATSWLGLAALALAQTVCAAPPVPAIDARETVWSEYVAAKWRETPGTECVAEYRTNEGSRVDVVCDYDSFLGRRRIAFEIERASKWKESIGQAVFYEEKLGADQGGVVLLMLKDTDGKHLLRCATACQRCELLLFIVTKDGRIEQVNPVQRARGPLK